MKKTVLITGGAQGIGRATVLKLAESGYDIVINYLTSQKEAGQLCEYVQKEYGVKSIAVKADVADEAAVDEMFTKAENELGEVDILINNAAVDMPELFMEKTAEDFRKVLDVNVIGAYNCAKRAYRSMLKKEYGRIINISSTNGINTYYPVCLDYDASKAALISLTHNLAVQFAPYVTVNAIAPGFIGTEHELAGYDEEFLKQETGKILVGRYGKPEEVASLICYLISDEASFINNAVIRIDGGQMGSC